MTTPYVLNEYIHLHEAGTTDLGWWAEYEPLDHPAISFTLSGYIHIEDGSRTICFCSSRTNEDLLIMDTDEVQYAGFQSNSIHLLWKEDPGDHYICVTYEVGSRRYIPIPSWDWKKEGF